MTLMKLNHRTPAYYPSFFNEFFNVESPASVRRTASAPANIFETEHAFHLELNVPGRSREDFKVSIDKNLLTVQYEKSKTADAAESKWVRREFDYTSFTRSFTIDDSIDATKIEAKYENGILKFMLPKAEEKKNEARTIAIQ